MNKHFSLSWKTNVQPYDVNLSIVEVTNLSRILNNDVDDEKNLFVIVFFSDFDLSILTAAVGLNSFHLFVHCRHCYMMANMLTTTISLMSSSIHTHVDISTDTPKCKLHLTNEWNQVFCFVLKRRKRKLLHLVH